MILLYRAISKAEKEDFEKDGQFSTGRNTLEAKQFFQSEEAVMEFIKEAKKQSYRPYYKYLLHVTLDKDCLESISYVDQELDGFKAITIYEIDWVHFNNCINFAERYGI